MFKKTLENALLCLTKTIDKIMTGEIELKDLIISKQLLMDIAKYKSIFPNVAAAIQLTNDKGKKPVRGERIKYIYTDSQHQNPLYRVLATDIPQFDSSLNYDKEKIQRSVIRCSRNSIGNVWI